MEAETPHQVARAQPSHSARASNKVHSNDSAIPRLKTVSEASASHIPAGERAESLLFKPLTPPVRSAVLGHQRFRSGHTSVSPELGSRGSQRGSIGSSHLGKRGEPDLTPDLAKLVANPCERQAEPEMLRRVPLITAHSVQKANSEDKAMYKIEPPCRKPQRRSSLSTIAMRALASHTSSTIQL